MALAEQAEIPFAPVNQPVDLWDDPHMNQSGGLASTTTPSGGTVKLPKLPLRLDGRPFDLRLQPPAVGEGAADLLRMAGLTPGEIDELAAAEIIALPRPSHPA